MKAESAWEIAVCTIIWGWKRKKLQWIQNTFSGKCCCGVVAPSDYNNWSGDWENKQKYTEIPNIIIYGAVLSEIISKYRYKSIDKFLVYGLQERKTKWSPIIWFGNYLNEWYRNIHNEWIFFSSPLLQVTIETHHFWLALLIWVRRKCSIAFDSWSNAVSSDSQLRKCRSIRRLVASRPCKGTESKRTLVGLKPN